jgi:membrane protein
MGDDLMTSASSFAYHMIFAIPPLMILTVTIAALVNRLTSLDVTTMLQRQIEDHAPPATRQLLRAVVDQALVRVSSGGASLGVAATALLALWSGASALGSLIRAFNRAYGVEETRSFVQRTRLKLILTLVFTLSINLAFAAIVFGHRIGAKVANVFDLSARFERLWNLLTWPTAVVAVALLLALLYYAGPNVDLSFRWISPGSITATTLWLAGAALFGWYLDVANPGSAYGALGSVVVLLFFLDVTGVIFLLGAKLNAEIGKRFDPLTIDDLATTTKTKPGVRTSARRRLRTWLSKGAPRPVKQP